jgi:hypothetical protein
VRLHKWPAFQRHITANATEELKLDGFRALAYLENEERLVSRIGNTFASFRNLAAQVARKFPRGGCKVKGTRYYGNVIPTLPLARLKSVTLVICKHRIGRIMHRGCSTDALDIAREKQSGVS